MSAVSYKGASTEQPTWHQQSKIYIYDFAIRHKKKVVWTSTIVVLLPMFLCRNESKNLNGFQMQ